MGNEITSHEPTEIQSVLSIIKEAALNPAVDVNKMEQLLSMQERIMDRQARAAFIEAEMHMHGQLPTIAKNGAIMNNAGVVQSRFSRWEDVHRTIGPILHSNSFSLSFEIGTDNNMTTVEAVLSHVGGHVKRSGAMRLPTDSSGAKNAVQGVGSTVSYGKRYTTLAILNISTGDDTDGARQDPLPPTAEWAEILLDAESAADKGIAAYEAFFKALPSTQKRELIARNVHDRLKKRAANAGTKKDDFPGDTGASEVQPNFDNLDPGGAGNFDD